MIRRWGTGQRTLLASLLSWPLAAACAGGLGGSVGAQVLPAQVLPEDDPSVPDSLRFQSPGEPADSAAIPTDWTVDEGGGFDLVFDDLRDEDLDVKEDYSGAFKLWPYLHYNRVDAFALGLEFGFAPDRGWYPAFDFRFVHAFNRDHQWLYVFGFRQPVCPDRRVVVGVESRLFTDHFDGDRVASAENFFSALLFKYDYRDYFERRGASYFVEGKLLPKLKTRLAYERHRYTSIPETASGTWSVFRNSRTWRENPSVDEGRLGSVVWDAQFESRPPEESYRDGVALRGGLEIASKGVGSDRTYSSYYAEGSGHWSPIANLRFKGRLLFGTTGVGSLPFQKQFAIGGISTLRGHPYKSSRGDQMLLGNAETQLRLLRGRERAGVRTDLRAVAFLDVGQAWLGDSFDLSKQAIQVDAGLGLAAADERLALYVAQNLRSSKFDPLFSFRLSQPF